MLVGPHSWAHASPAVALSLVTLLWQGDLGEQKLCIPASGLVLVPEGTKVVGRSIEDGTSRFSHVMVERHGPLDVPCRIQGVEALRRRPLALPGLGSRVAEPAEAPGLLCLAGQKELHCLSLPAGRLLWSAPKEDGCVLSLHAVGDVDGDGTDDVVCCGCNVAECFSGRTGRVLWRFGVSGRSLWAGACGDLDRDRLGDVLLQAGSELRVLSPVRGGTVRTLFQPSGFLPRATVAVEGGFLVGFGGASVWLWSRDGDGRKIWESKTRLLGIHAIGGRRVISATEGLWVSDPAGGWRHALAGSVRAAGPHGDRLLAVDGDGRLLAFRPEDGSATRLAELGEFGRGVDDVRIEAGGRHACMASGGTFRVYRLEILSEGETPSEDSAAEGR